MEIQEKTTKPLPTRFYVCCPIYSAMIMQARTVVDGIIKCERCHKRVWFEIKDGKVTAIPLSQKDKLTSEL